LHTASVYHPKFLFVNSDPASTRSAFGYWQFDPSSQAANNGALQLAISENPGTMRVTGKQKQSKMKKQARVGV